LVAQRVAIEVEKLTTLEEIGALTLQGLFKVFGMHQTIPDRGHWLKQVVTGHFAYYAVPTNSRHSGIT
jgi:hypothetical protein